MTLPTNVDTPSQCGHVFRPALLPPGEEAHASLSPLPLQSNSFPSTDPVIYLSKVFHPF
jgi:hypothetical protein